MLSWRGFSVVLIFKFIIIIIIIISLMESKYGGKLKFFQIQFEKNNQTQKYFVRPWSSKWSLVGWDIKRYELRYFIEASEISLSVLHPLFIQWCAGLWSSGLMTCFAAERAAFIFPRHESDTAVGKRTLQHLEARVFGSGFPLRV